MGPTNLDKKHVLVVAHDAALYGAQNSLLDILRCIDREKFDLFVAIPSRGAFTEVLQELNIPYIAYIVQRWIFYPRHINLWKLFKRPWRGLTYPYFLTILSLISLPVRIMLLICIVRARKIDLIYTNTATVLDGAIIARLCGIPHVWHLRESIVGNPDLVRVLLPERWFPTFVKNNSAIVIANSDSLAKKMFGVDLPQKLQVVYNGVDIELFRTALPTKVLPDLLGDTRFVAICGAINARKDVLTFIRAAARLHTTHPLIHFLIIGHGQSDYYSLVEKEVYERGLEEYVHFLGHRSDIPGLFARVEILVNASTQEPFGRTIIEAMAAGKPVVATRSGGPQEILEDGISGYLVDVGDDISMADRIAALLDHPKRMQDISNSARLRVEAHFELCSMVKRIEEAFRTAMLR